MTNVALSARGLGKRYRIGQERAEPKGLARKALRSITAPFDYLRSALSTATEAETLWALRDVSFDVERGEVVGIVGKNGAGKSTLLKVLTRITEPTEGKAEIHGRVAALLEVGTGFHPELTGRENVFMNGAILGMRRAEIAAKFDEIVAFAGVQRFIDTPVKRYSSGMRVRLGFAVAAHLDPEVLLVDEVLAVGDADFQRKCLGKISEVASAGRTVLFVSHNMASILDLCTRAYWLDGGRLRLDGGVREVVEAYVSGMASEATADLDDHPQRRGEHSLMKRVRLLSPGGEEDSFATRSEFTLEVEARVQRDLFRTLSLGFVVRDAMGSAVFASHLNQYEEHRVESDQTVIIRASVDQLPLAPGTYSLALYLSNGAHNLDIVDPALSFNVLWDGSLPARYPPLEKWGPVFCPVSWAVIPVESVRGELSDGVQ